MKNTLLTIMLALAAGAGGAAAQEYHPLAVTQGGGPVETGVAAASINATPSDAIGLTKYGDVTLVLQYNLAGPAASPGNVVFSFAPSADGTNFSSAPPGNLVFALPSNGTNTVTLVTNVSVGATGYLELFSIGNSATNAATNISVQGWVKPKRNG
jgi:hypothetical protein